MLFVSDEYEVFFFNFIPYTMHGSYTTNNDIHTIMKNTKTTMTK